MNKEEIAYKLIELYYTNNRVFREHLMTLKDVINEYNKILEILRIGLGK